MILHGIIYNSYQKKYGCNDITYAGGYFYEIKSGNLANGELDCLEDGYSYGYSYRSYANYKDGIKVGKWLYTENNDTIQHGEIIVNTKLNKLLSKKFRAKHLGLKISNESDIVEFYLQIYEPKKVLDSIKIQSMVNTDLRAFMVRNQVNKVCVVALNSDGIWSDKDSYELLE